MKTIVVRDGVIENIIELDAGAVWTAPEGSSAHECSATCAVGWLWNDGDPLPPVPPAEDALRDAKAAAVAEIAAAHDAAIEAGLSFEGVVYQIDKVSQGNIMALALFARACIDGAAEWPEDFGWIARDNTRPTFTAESFWQFAVAAQARVSSITLTARALKDAVAAAPDIGALSAIDIGFD